MQVQNRVHIVATDIITESCHCPGCNVPNIPWVDACAIAGAAGVQLDSCTHRGHIYDVDGVRFSIGSGCWDSSYGDECGACGNTYANPDNYISVFQ